MRQNYIVYTFQLQQEKTKQKSVQKALWEGYKPKLLILFLSRDIMGGFPIFLLNFLNLLI